MPPQYLRLAPTYIYIYIYMMLNCRFTEANQTIKGLHEREKPQLALMGSRIKANPTFIIVSSKSHKKMIEKYSR